MYISWVERRLARIDYLYALVLNRSGKNFRWEDLDLTTVLEILFLMEQLYDSDKKVLVGTALSPDKYTIFADLPYILLRLCKNHVISVSPGSALFTDEDIETQFDLMKAEFEINVSDAEKHFSEYVSGNLDLNGFSEDEKKEALVAAIHEDMISRFSDMLEKTGRKLIRTEEDDCRMRSFYGEYSYAEMMTQCYHVVSCARGTTALRQLYDRCNRTKSIGWTLHKTDTSLAGDRLKKNDIYAFRRRRDRQDFIKSDLCGA